MTATRASEKTMNARTKILAVLGGSLGLMWMSPALAYSSFQSDVPNGYTYGCKTCHNTSGGSGANPLYDEIRNNSFGQPNWSSDYSKDADGDGQTNGQELGDPCGSWSPGSSPQYTTGLSNPGFASDTNSIAACGGGGTTDTTPPTVSISSPTGGTVSGGVTITASASDNTGVTRVDLKVDGSTIASVNSSPYRTTWATGSVANGTHRITADAYDAAGNMGTSQSVTVTVSNQTADTQAPTVSLSSPTGGTVSGAVSIKATASDNVAVTRVDFTVDGTTISSATSAPFQATWASGGVANGSHTLSANAYDAAGNKGTARSVTVTVSNTTSDTTPPTATVSSPTNGATVSGSSVTLSATANDNVAVTEVDFIIDGSKVGSAMTLPWSYVWDSTTVSNSNHTFKVKAFDSAGNEGDSVGVGFVVGNGGGGGGTDTSPPQVTLTSPSAGDTVSGVAVAVAADATDNVAVTRVDFKVDGANVGSAISAPWSATFDSNFFKDGSHTLTAEALDASGNKGVSTGINITISNGSVAVGGGGADGGTDGNPPAALGGCSTSPGQSSSAFLALFFLAGGLMIIRKRW